MTRENNKKLRIIYAGSPEFAVPALEALIHSEHEVVAVYTQPDRPAGRGKKMTAQPVKIIAEKAGIDVVQIESFKDEGALETLESYHADLMVVAAYSLLLPQVVLDMPKYGCINIHGSLLPRWRGAAPIHRAIQAGDKETGVTIMQMALGLDTGDMLYKITCPIRDTDTGQSIHDQLSSDGADALMSTLDLLVEGKLEPEVQNDSLTCYAHKLSKKEAEIDWSASAKKIDCSIRAFDAWPVAYTLMDGERLRFFMSSAIETTTDGKIGEVVAESKKGIEIVTGEGSVLITRLQMPNKKAMDAKDFLNGRSLLGQVFPS
ncbi:MAG: methionyl-tRNA formyltransferase [Aquificaceae bacterium]|nr:MAG: methionyl-tRNA formyltransferase [Aquificaceae bacterium]